MFIYYKFVVYNLSNQETIFRYLQKDSHSYDQNTFSSCFLYNSNLKYLHHDRFEFGHLHHEHVDNVNRNTFRIICCYRFI